MSSAINCASKATASTAAAVCSVDIVKQTIEPAVESCQRQNAHSVNKSLRRAVSSSGVSPRPVVHAEFGRYLTEIRMARGLSQSQVARALSRTLPAVTRQVLLHLEAGKTKDPDP